MKKSMMKLVNFIVTQACSEDYETFQRKNRIFKLGCIILLLCFSIGMVILTSEVHNQSVDFTYDYDEYLDEDSLEEPPQENFKELEENLSTEESVDTTKSKIKEEVESIPISLTAKKSLKYYEKQAKSLGLPEDYNIDKAIKGMEYLVGEQNFSPEGAAGIIGNLFSESRFDGAEVYGSHKGIAQWDVNRWPHIEEWLYVNDYRENSFLGQLMAMFESEDAKHFQETFNAMRKMSDAEDAALFWLERYEKAPGQAESERQRIAQLTFELYTA